MREVYANPFVLRFVPASGPAAVASELLEAFTSARFRLGTRVSRMGYRLEGATLAVAAGTLLSEPIPPGTIQLPPGGEPILLMADRPTVGGYLRLGSVLRADFPRAAQLITGHTVRFVPASLAQALASLVAQEALLARIAA